jgi:hypothetical protein
MEAEFEAYMKSFAPTPIDSSVTKPMAGSKRKFQLKRPNDSRQMQGSLGSASAQGLMNPMKVSEETGTDI